MHRPKLLAKNNQLVHKYLMFGIAISWKLEQRQKYTITACPSGRRQNYRVDISSYKKDRDNLIGLPKSGSEVLSRYFKKFGLVWVILGEVRGDRILPKFTSSHFHPYSLCWRKNNYCYL